MLEKRFSITKNTKQMQNWVEVFEKKSFKMSQRAKNAEG